MPEMTDETARHRAGILLCVAALFVLTVMDVASKMLARDYPVMQIIWVRYVLFAGFAVSLTWHRHRRLLPLSKAPVLQSARGLILVGSNFLVIMSFGLMPLADVHAVLAAAPLIVTALSIPFLGERVGPRRWAAVAVGFSGVLIILRPGLGVFQPEALLPLAAAGTFAAYQVTTRLVSRRDEMLTTLAYTAVVGLAATSLVGPFVWVAPDAEGWLLLLVAAVLGLASHILLIKALELAPASLLQPYNYTMLVWATALGFAVWGDFPDVPTVAGALVIVASGLYTFHRERARAGHGH